MLSLKVSLYAAGLLNIQPLWRVRRMSSVISCHINIFNRPNIFLVAKTNIGVVCMMCDGMFHV